MANSEQIITDHKPEKGNSETFNDLEFQKIPQELKDLQQLTHISDQHVQKLVKTYKNELETSPLLLGLEAYYGEIKDTKSLENLIDKISEKKLTNEEMVKYIVEDCLNVRTSKKDLTDLKEDIDYDKKIDEFLAKIDLLENKTFDDTKLDNDSRNKAIETIKDPVERLITSYISTKDIVLPEVETIAKNSSAAQDPRFKDASSWELIEQTDKVPGTIVKDLKLDPEQAKIIKELNYKTFIQIINTNHTLINPELVVDAVKHEKSTDKIQDKIIQKGAISDTARQKYGPKISKAVLNYSIDKVFGNALFKKSAAAKEIKTELDVANLLTQYVISGEVSKTPKSSIDKNQSYTDKRATIKNETESFNKETAIKNNDQELDATRTSLYEVTVQKDGVEDKEVADIINDIQCITGGHDVETIKSKKREYGESSTLCSKTACLNIQNLIDASTMASIDKEEAKDMVPKGEAKKLLSDLLKQKAAEKIHLPSFTDPQDIQKFEDYLKQKILESKGNIFDIYMYTKGKHRNTIFLASDGKLYALDPYYGGNKTQKPVPIADLLRNMSDKVMKNDIIISNTISGQISAESQKKLQQDYKKITENISLQNKLIAAYGNEDIIDILALYDEDTPYQDENITDIPPASEVISEAPKQPEIVTDGFTIGLLKLHIPKIYGGITYEDLYTAITNISDPSLKTKCIQKIKAEKIMDFQLLLGMLKNAPLENKADGKVGAYTLAKIRDKITIATAQNP